MIFIWDVFKFKGVIVSFNEFDNVDKVEDGFCGYFEFFINGYRGGKDKRKLEVDFILEDERNVKRIYLIGDIESWDIGVKEMMGFDEGEIECDIMIDFLLKIMVDVCI